MMAGSGGRTALISPMADFWLVGGLSLLVLLAGWVISDLMAIDVRSTLGWWAFYAAFAINFPHFAYSYQLFYAGYAERLRQGDADIVTKARLLIAGVIVPIFMLNYFVMTYVMESRDMLALAVSAMFASVGWHYVKQGYGVLITLSLYKKIFYSVWEKRIILINAYVIWLYTLLKVNSVVGEHKYYDVPYATIALPHWMLLTAGIAAIIMGVLFVGVFVRIWFTRRKDLPVNALTGYIAATYLWVIFPSINPLFFLFVPLFHSLQYLPFVYRYKISEFNANREGLINPLKHPVAFAIAGIIMGGLFMHFLPVGMDMLHNGSRDFFTESYFLVSMLLFINIHHYFIDSSFWRRDNKRVQDYLFSAR